MAQAAESLKSFFQDNYTRAQSRIVSLASTTGATDRLGELTQQFSVKELGEKLRAVETLTPDFKQQLGFASTGDVLDLSERLAELTKTVSALSKRVATLEKAAPKKAAAKKAAPKKAAVKKAAPKKAAAKKAPAK